ncbi:MAG: hypothetical protein JNN13_03560 [Planctomycetes bacterium]|nr:hypothetical protein [Planctomycetota bacterium]
MSANRIARWDNYSWSPLGAGFNYRVNTITTLPNGDLVAGGTFASAGAQPANNVARWNGSAWSPIGGGLTNSTSVFSVPAARAVVFDKRGELCIGGVFLLADSVPSHNFARLATSCPAAVTSVGTGCASSGGTAVLEASGLPWIGSDFLAIATGLPASTALSIYGFTPIVPGFPIDSLFAAALPGCNAYVSLDLLGLLNASTGVAYAQLTLPNSPQLVGGTLYHQLVAFGAGEIAATNALQLTVGSF